jgi:hypothetical protein
MAIDAVVRTTKWSDHNLIVYAECRSTQRSVVLVIERATVEPQPGDLILFGSEGVRQMDGRILGGSGHIAGGGVTYPYRRIASDRIVQDWPPLARQEEFL